MAAACGRSAEDGEACGLKEGGPHSSRVCLKRHSLQVELLKRLFVVGCVGDVWREAILDSCR